MLNFITFFGHAGEQHATVAESQTHYLQEWYVALPLFILAVAFVGLIAYWVSKKSKAAALLAVSAALLVGGVGLYTTSAVVSIVALASGLGLTLFSVLTSLSKD